MYVNRLAYVIKEGVVLVIVILSLCNCQKDIISRSRLCKLFNIQIASKTVCAIREEAYRNDRIRIFSKYDTVFVIEACDLEEGILKSVVWSHLDTLKYVYVDDHINVGNFKNQFSAELISSIARWDTNTVRENEKLKSNFVFGGSYICAFRIIRNRPICIDTFQFNEYE